MNSKTVDNWGKFKAAFCWLWKLIIPVRLSVEVKTKTQVVVNNKNQKAKAFLVCPIDAKDGSGKQVTASTVKISAVVDHSGTPLDPDYSNSRWYQDNNEVKAFSGEVGDFKKFKEELLELFKDSYESKVQDYFDFLSWVDSKIEGKSFAEVVQRKVQDKTR